MQYVAIYQLGRELQYLEFKADDWADAFGVWLERRPIGSLLRVIAEREQFDWEVTGNGIDILVSVR